MTDVRSIPTLHISSHPAVLHKLAILRNEATEPKKFGEVVRELSWLLGYEALADARLRPLSVRTPLETIQALSSKPLLSRNGEGTWSYILHNSSLSPDLTPPSIFPLLK